MSGPGSVRPVARVVISLRARRRGAPQRAGLHVMSSAEHDRQLPRCVQHSSHDDEHKAGSSKLSPAPVRAGSRITCFTVRRSTQLRWWGLPGEQQTAQAQRVGNLTRDGAATATSRTLKFPPRKWRCVLRPLPVWRCTLRSSLLCVFARVPVCASVRVRRGVHGEARVVARHHGRSQHGCCPRQRDGPRHVGGGAQPC